MHRNHLLRAAIAVPLILLLAAVGVASCGGDDGDAGDDPTQIRIGFTTWVGYGPIWVAEDQGFFADEGLDVRINVIEDAFQRFNAMKAGSLEANATTVDEFARGVAEGIPAVQVLAVDYSTGGDGIVARNDIESVADFEGQDVAVNEGSVSEFFLGYVLDEQGLSLDDVNIRNLTPGDAGAAFAAGRVPVAVTWEPWLSRAEENPDGQVLLTSSDYPGLITDSVAFTPDFIEENPDAVEGFIRAWQRALDFVESNPDDAYPVMAQQLGIQPDEVPEFLEAVTYVTIEENQEYFGTPEDPGAIYDVFGSAGEFWQERGVIDSVANPDQWIDPSFLDEL